MTNTKTIVYYISDSAIKSRDFIKMYKSLPAYIHVVIDFNDNTITVIDLHSNIKNKDYATHLLIYACTQAMKTGIPTMVLDDCTDRYRKPNNIYTKVGMNYINEEGPEMYGKTYIVGSYPTKTDSPTIYYHQIKN